MAQGPKPDELLPPARNFSLSLAERVRAQEGAPAHLRRKRAIEDLRDAAVALLASLRASGLDDNELYARAQALDLRRLNELVDRHNRYYPIEANLPIDLRTGALLDHGEPFRPLAPVTPASLVALVDGASPVGRTFR